MKSIRAKSDLIARLIGQNIFLILILLLFSDTLFRSAYGGNDLFIGSYLTSLIFIIVGIGCVTQIAIGVMRIFGPETSRTCKPFLRSLLPVVVLLLVAFSSEAVDMGLLKFRIATEKTFDACREHARPIGNDGAYAWCEGQDQSGPVGSYNMFAYVLYDSTDQITLPYAKRSMAWKKSVITHKYRSVFTSAYEVKKISGHYYRILSWMNEQGKGDPVSSDLPQTQLKYCPGANKSIIPVCPGQDDAN